MSCDASSFHKTRVIALGMFRVMSTLLLMKQSPEIYFFFLHNYSWHIGIIVIIAMFVSTKHCHKVHWMAGAGAGVGVWVRVGGGGVREGVAKCFIIISPCK